MHHNFHCNIIYILYFTFKLNIAGTSSFGKSKIVTNNMFDPAPYDSYFEYTEKIDSSVQILKILISVLANPCI